MGNKEALNDLPENLRTLVEVYDSMSGESRQLIIAFNTARGEYEGALKSQQPLEKPQEDKNP